MVTGMYGSESRTEILERALAAYIQQGCRLVSRTEVSAQLLRPKRFNPVAAGLWFLVLGIGIIGYTIFFLLVKRDTMVYIEVDAHGRVDRLERPTGGHNLGEVLIAAALVVGTIGFGGWLGFNVLKGFNLFTGVHVCAGSDYSASSYYCQHDSDAIATARLADGHIVAGAQIQDTIHSGTVVVILSRKVNGSGFFEAGRATYSACCHLQRVSISLHDAFAGTNAPLIAGEYQIEADDGSGGPSLGTATFTLKP